MKTNKKMNFFEKQNEKDKYAEYLRRIDPAAVLTYYGAQNSFEVSRGDDGVEIQHSCLIDKVDPHHTNGDKNPSARMNVDKKLYFCFSYGGGDILWLIKTMEQKDSFVEIVPILGQFLSDATESKEDFLDELEKYLSSKEFEDIAPTPKYSERVLRPWAVTHPYLIHERGMSHEACTRLRVGYDDEDKRIVFPLFFEGKLLGWQKRAVPPGLGYESTRPDSNGVLAKYKNTVSYPKQSTLYNFDLVKSRKREEVVIVESPMSCLKAETLTSGDDLLAGVISTQGAKTSSFQAEKLRAFKKVYVFFDSDDAGRMGAEKLTRELYRHTECWVVNPEPGKDLADYSSKEEVLTLIKNNSRPAFMELADWDKKHARKRFSR